MRLISAGPFRTAGGVSETYNYDPEERLTSVAWNGGSNCKNFTYDTGGRITSINNTGSTRTFTYDEESRLTAISGAYTASYEYNGLRTRVEKTEASVTRTFLRDGASPTSPVLNDGAAAYTPGTSERRGSTTTYMHSGIKNADLQTNTSEVQTAERTYDAFGNLTASSGSFVGPFGYGGQFGYQEDGSGMKLLGNRYYDPSIGRFLTRDPLKDGTNWYAYCENNPVTSYDADGLDPNRAVFNSADEAAVDAMKWLNKKKKWKEVEFGDAEYGGTIYRDPKTGKYGYTVGRGPQSGWVAPGPPKGMEDCGSWHTHPVTGHWGLIPSSYDSLAFGDGNWHYIMTCDGKIVRFKRVGEYGDNWMIATGVRPYKTPAYKVEQ